MVQSSTTDIKALKELEGKLDPKRISRSNTTFFFACDLKDMKSFLS